MMRDLETAPWDGRRARRGAARLRVYTTAALLLLLGTPAAGGAQRPAAERGPAGERHAPAGAGLEESAHTAGRRAHRDPLIYHTFSIAAVDPETGETGVAVTTRVPCVGNAVPHVRAGVGAVATQAWTRVEYGPELLDALADGRAPAAALSELLAADSMADRRQVGVIAADGGSAQHTGTGTTDWKGHRAGPNYVTQGNLLVGPEVLEAVAQSFEATAGSGRHLADRLIAALEAGQAAGGDARKGRLQSAAMIVADPRPERSRRPDRVTADINVCEHAAPVAELRRVYRTISGTLGWRELKQYRGADVWQLHVILHALGYYHADRDALAEESENFLFNDETVAAVEAFRADRGLSTRRLGSPPGLVDQQTVALLWQALEERGLADGIRARLREVTAVRR